MYRYGKQINTKTVKLKVQQVIDKHLVLFIFYYHFVFTVVVTQYKTKEILKTNFKAQLKAMTNICIYYFMKMNQIVGKQTMSATMMHQKMDLRLTQLKFALIK